MTLGETRELPGMLTGLRVVEFADESAEYAGLLLAGLGAEVVKIEPPGGSPTRQIGPFHNDTRDSNGSLFFWSHNRGKSSVVLDLASDAGRRDTLDLIATADVLLDSSRGRLNDALGLSRAALQDRFPALVVARMTPFGDVGPWKDFKGSDLVHLALGGVMMNCGYDPDPTGNYDLPPIAPQLWHAYHIAGDQLVMGIVASLIHREQTGRGQDVACAVHAAVSVNTEVDLMSWVMRRAPLYRQTCRHAVEKPARAQSIAAAKDGRWYMTYDGSAARDESLLFNFLKGYGMEADLDAAESAKPETGGRAIPGTGAMTEKKAHRLEVAHRLVRSYTYENVPWREAQDAGLMWVPLRKPGESTSDEHWIKRTSIRELHHPELGKSLPYPVSKWLSTATSWKTGRRAPLLGEDTATMKDLLAVSRAATAKMKRAETTRTPTLSARGQPFALQGIRIFDFSWFLATAGGTRFLAGLGAECLKVEWKGNPDTRLAAMSPVGGRAAREAATAPLQGVTDGDMGGQFNNKNPGKRGMSLNIRHPKGLEIAKRLIAMCDVVAEGFSPGVMERAGLGYDVLKAIKPDIIYVQQSGMGAEGTYGRFRTVGPVAAAFAGTSEMSGLPEPAPPAGWGYSYLDWAGAYGFALAILSALLHRQRTGEGQYIDSSQCESGLFLAGIPILDEHANQRQWTRIGNRSPYKPAAPHGAYRCAGVDRWIAIACFDDGEWQGFAKTAGLEVLTHDPRFATLEARLRNQDALDAAVNEWTTTQDAFACMVALQSAGVPAGVCQNAEDRCEHDPQLKALEWMTEVTGTKIGRWPVTELPVKLDATPSYMGGPIDRAAPCYGEDNQHVLSTWLGFSDTEIQQLADEGVI
ncbi:MAG: CoA transferase [Pseudomonadota bacterium]